jgi:hypothetical protein
MTSVALCREAARRSPPAVAAIRIRGAAAREHPSVGRFKLRPGVSASSPTRRAHSVQKRGKQCTQVTDVCKRMRCVQGGSHCDNEVQACKHSGVQALPLEGRQGQL